ncbi:MAG: hypothetical protein ABSC37_19325 [Xanthobacteraceae bacterium]|jgi:hypothetical protein
MKGFGARRRLAGLLIGVTLLLGACAGNHPWRSNAGDDEGLNAYPANYKSDILAAMHAYLNDPSGVRDAAVAEPALKPVGNSTHYVVCLRFNAKKSASEYAGAKEIAAVFLAGRFDRFVETAREQCADATYAPFPELEKLPR